MIFSNPCPTSHVPCPLEGEPACLAAALRRRMVRRPFGWLICTLLLVANGTLADAPAWWQTRNVINTNIPPKDYAALNMGQLKLLAFAAWQEMETIPGGAGFTPAFTNGLNNYASVNVGQLKEAARPFYRRFRVPCPWQDTIPAADYAIANIGQAKFLFSFDPWHFSDDTDGDGIPDGWEEAYGLNPANPADAGLDSDHDSLSSLEEYQNGTHPDRPDTDGDGMLDGWEVDYDLDPADAADASLDADNDGLTNLEEFQLGTYPDNPDSDNDTLTDFTELNWTGIMAWGLNNGGQCNVPVPLTDATAVAGGYLHSLALLRDGTVLAWGNNGYGQCNVPVSASNVIAVAAGQYHSLVLRKDRTILAWGHNNFQQCNVPAQATNVIAIAAGAYHSLAVCSDGSVVAWGMNFNGQCSMLSSVTNAVAVAAGERHSIALLSDGTVAGGDASTTNVVRIAAGKYHSLALRGDGTVVAWGDSAYGLCTVPTSVTNAVAIAGGEVHSFALRSDGKVVAWGIPTSWGPLSYGQCAGATNVFSAIAVASGLYHGLAILRLDPLNRDTDNDGLLDGWEATHGSDPLNPLDPGSIGIDVDSDGDGMPDLWEIANGFDRYSDADAAQDTDGDGLSNLDEYLLGTPPRNAGSAQPPGTQESAPVYGSGQTGLLILTPSPTRN